MTTCLPLDSQDILGTVQDRRHHKPTLPSRRCLRGRTLVHPGRIRMRLRRARHRDTAARGSRHVLETLATGRWPERASARGGHLRTRWPHASLRTKQQLPLLYQEVVAAVQSSSNVSYSPTGAGSSSERFYVVVPLWGVESGSTTRRAGEAKIPGSGAYASLLDANEAARTLWQEVREKEVEGSGYPEHDATGAVSDMACHSGSTKADYCDGYEGRTWEVSVQELKMRKNHQVNAEWRPSPTRKTQNSQKARSRENRRRELPALSSHRRAVQGSIWPA